MPVIRISKRTLDDIPSVDRQTIFYDADLKGFGLKVMPSGVRSWVVEYRPGISGRGTAKRRVVLGSPSVMTPEQARKVAKETLASARVGADPASERSGIRRGMTVTQVADAFLAEHVEVRRKGRTLKSYTDILNRLVKPEVGSIKAAALTRADVAKLHLAQRAAPFQANRMIAVLGSMYTFAGKRSLVPEGYNPARGVEKYGEAGRERFLTTEEMDRLGGALRDAETVGIEWTESDVRPKSKHQRKPANRRTVLGEHATAAIRLLLLTGCRLREILDLEWDDIDFERGLLLLRDSKTGRKPVILNTAAIDVLEGLKRVGKCVIAGDTLDKPRADLKKPWRLISGAAGLSGVRLHDLRHSFASVGAVGGQGLLVIGKLLGHSQAVTTQRYAHLDADPLRKATNAIGDTISAAIGKKK